MSSRKTLAAAALAISALSGSEAHAVTLTLGAGWEPVIYVNPNYPDPYGGPIYDYYTGDTDFTFTLTNHADLNITDLFYNLDRFELTINGVDQGETFYPNQGYAYTGDPDLAFTDPHFSHASYALGPGTYDVTGVADYSPYGEGVAAIELAVPEPAAWAMMLLGFGVIGGFMRRRPKRAAITA
jgi:hypothetical protein